VATSAQYSTTFNGPETYARGFELDYSQQLSFLPGALRGLSAFANFTYTKPETPELFTGGSGTPRKSGNFGIGYRNGRLNGQVKVNWVDDRLLATPGYALNVTTGKFAPTTGANAGVNQYEKDRTQIDVNVDYGVHRYATLFVNVANLTGSPSVRYSVNERNMIRNGAYGAKYTFGIKGTF
jgi:hypothetical protein